MAESSIIEGIVIKTVPFQDNKKVITLFTEEGILGLITTVNEKKPASFLIATPLSIGEYIYQNSKGNLKKLIDGTVYQSYLHFNQSLCLLEAASVCLKAILISQLETKPSKALYQLTKVYLQKMPTCKEPLKLATSFHLKVLKHEGLFSIESFCYYCNKKKASGFFDKLPCCDCINHPKKIFFSDLEWDILKVLFFSTQFHLIEGIECPENLSRKVIGLFESFYLEN